MSEIHVSDDDLSTDDILAEASAKSEELTLLMAGDLVAEYQAVRDRVSGRIREQVLASSQQARSFKDRVDAGDDRLSSKLPDATTVTADPEGTGDEELSVKLEPDPEQDLLDELGAKIKKRWLRIRLTAVPASVYNALAAQHPVRWLDDGRQDPRDVRAGVNTDTFYDPLIRACLAVSTMTPRYLDQWKPVTPAQVNAIMAKVNPGQFDELAGVAARINVLGYTNVPF